MLLLLAEVFYTLWPIEPIFWLWHFNTKVILRKVCILTCNFRLLLLLVGTTYSFMICIKLLTKDRPTASYNFYLSSLFSHSFTTGSIVTSIVLKQLKLFQTHLHITSQLIVALKFRVLHINHRVAWFKP